MPTADRSHTLITAVLAAERMRGEALVHGDAAALAALLDEELRYTHSGGKLECKSEIVNALAEKRIAFAHFTTSDLHGAVLTDSIVVVTGKIDQRKFNNGTWADAKLLFQAVWRYRDGAWRMVAIQTAVPPAPKA